MRAYLDQIYPPSYIWEVLQIISSLWRTAKNYFSNMNKGSSHQVFFLFFVYLSILWCTESVDENFSSMALNRQMSTSHNLHLLAFSYNSVSIFKTIHLFYNSRLNFCILKFTTKFALRCIIPNPMMALSSGGRINNFLFFKMIQKNITCILK